MFLFRLHSGASFTVDSVGSSAGSCSCGKCLRRIASVSACALDVADGKASFGVGRGVDMMLRMKTKSKIQNTDKTTGTTEQ